MICFVIVQLNYNLTGTDLETILRSVSKKEIEPDPYLITENYNLICYVNLLAKGEV